MLGMIVRENDYITSDEAVLAAAEMGYEIEETRDDILEDYLTPLNIRKRNLSADRRLLL
jgi:hypothetical protein